MNEQDAPITSNEGIKDATSKEIERGNVALHGALQTAGEVSNSIIGLDEHGQPVTKRDQQREAEYHQLHGQPSDDTRTRI